MKNNVIGISLLTNEHPFYRDLVEGIKSETEKIGGFELKIVYGEFDADKQAKQIEGFIADKVDVIVISPCSSVKIGDSIVKANNANIPVFTADISNNSGNGKVITHIASDNEQGGRLAARLIARAVGYSGKVGIIDHPGITSTEERVNGFREMIRKFPDIKVVSTVSAWGQREKAVVAMKKIVQDVPDVKGVFAINDVCALGALEVVEESKKTGQIFIVGYDAEMDVRKAISQGKIYADVRQYPLKIGQETIKSINEYFKGIKLPPVLLVEVGTWT